MNRAVLKSFSFMNGRVVSSISGRIIQNDTLYARNSVPELTEKMNIRVLQRLGGPNRVLVNNDPSYQVSFLWVIILIVASSRITYHYLFKLLSDIVPTNPVRSHLLLWKYCYILPALDTLVSMGVLG